MPVNSSTTLRWFLIAMLTILAGTASAFAEAVPTPSPTPSPGWTILVQPIAWVPTISTSITIPVQRPLLSAAVGGAISRDNTLTPSDMISKINMMLSGRVEARNDRWGVSGEIFYVRLSAPEQILASGGTLSVKQTIGQMNVFYRVMGAGPGDSIPVDILAGARYFNFDASLDFASSFGFVLNPSVSFTDPVVGLRTSFPLSDRLHLGLYGDVGFGTITTNRYGAHFLYSFRTWDAELGYLVMNFNKSDAGTQVNLQMSGPTLGASFKF